MHGPKIGTSPCESHTAASARTRRPIPLLLVAVLVAAATLPGTARAQIAEAWLHATPVPNQVTPFSARLEAMGDLEIAIEDEQNRIDIYRYSDNPAGLFADPDSSSLEQYSRYDQDREYYYGQLNAAQLRGSMVRINVRHGNDWTLGIDGSYGVVSANRHDLCPGPDDCRFIRDFDLPYPSDNVPVFGDRAITGTVEVPRLLVTYSRPLLFRRLIVGGRFGYVNQAESRIVPIQYPLNSQLNSYHLEGGALYDLLRGALSARIGANLGWSSDKIVSKSQTALSNDEYDWYRPLVWYSGQALIHYGSWVHGILDVRHRSYDGEDVGYINWAPQFYLNPLPADNQTYNIFKYKWSALLSGLRRNEVSTRWMADVRGTPLHVSAAWRYYREYEWFRPNDLVLPIGDPVDVRRLGYRVGGGLAIDFPENRGVVATEVHYARDHRIDYTGALPEIEPEEISYHLGAEYRALSWLPLRAGLVALRSNPDRLNGLPPVKGTRLTAGLGYDWAWLGTHLDLIWGHDHWSVPPGVVSAEVRSGDQVALVARYVF
jgi:hypothetical protein